MTNTSSGRSTQVIQTELNELIQVIHENQTFIDQYPDDNSLKLGLSSLLYRQDQLFNELQNSLQQSFMINYDIVVSGNDVAGGSIPLSIIGEFAGTYQNLIDSVVQKVHCHIDSSHGPISIETKKLSQLNLVATGVGSFRLLISSGPTLSDTSPSIEALEYFNKLVLCNNDIEQIKIIREILGLRTIKRYKDFIKTVVTHDLNISFYEHMSNNRYTNIKISKHQAKLIYDLIREVETMPILVESYIGIFTAINVEKSSFSFKTAEGVTIRGKYQDELSSFFNKPDFTQSYHVKFNHQKEYNETEDTEKDNWILVSFLDNNQ